MPYSRALFGTASIVALAISGCAPDGATPVAGVKSLANSQAGSATYGTIAVIDLDAVARQLGRDREMVAAIETHEASLNQQLQVVQASYQKDISQQLQEFGARPTMEQQHQLTNMRQRANGELKEVQLRAKDQMNQNRLLVIRQFRDEVRPIAREVARGKNLFIIVTKNDSVIFDYVASVEITNEVVERMQALQRQTP